MPNGLTFMSASVGVGTWRRIGSTFTWNVGNLPRGAGATLTVVAHPNILGTIVNTVVVGANDVDLISADNAITMVTTVFASAELSFHFQGSTLQLSWPANTGFVLESTDRLSPANWSNAGVSPQVVNSQNVVTVTPSATTRFFRLRSP